MSFEQSELTRTKEPNSPDSIVITGLDNGGNDFHKEYFFIRTHDHQGSLIDLAEAETGAIRETLINFSSQIHQLIQTQCAASNEAATVMAECSPTRDSSPWSLTDFSDLVCLAEVSRLIALYNPKRLTYHGSTRLIRDSLDAMCRNVEVDFEWVDTRRGRKVSAKRISKLSNFIRTRPLLHLVRAISVRQHLSLGDIEVDDDQVVIGLVAPLAHVDWDQLDSGRFSSSYWGSLPEKLVSWGAKVVYAHHVSPVLGHKDRRRVFRAFERVTAQVDGPTHMSTKPPLSLRIAVDAWRSWLNARPFLVQTLTFVERTVAQTEVEWFWRFVAPNVKSKLIGHVSLVDLASHFSMHSNLSRIPRVNEWIVVSENQTWEHDFISACRKGAPSRFNGFVHTPIRPWDLRYFSLAREMGSTGRGRQSSSYDRLFVGGELDRRFLTELIHDPDRIRRVESLRFLDRTSEKDHEAGVLSGPQLIAFGDYDRLESEVVVRVAESILARSTQTHRVDFQAHPLCRRRDGDLRQRLSEIRQTASRPSPSVPISIVSSRSSVLYSSLQAGHSVVVALGTRGLNFCPLAERPGLRFVAETSETTVFDMVVDLASSSEDIGDFLFLDEALPLWRSALAHASGGDSLRV